MDLCQVCCESILSYVINTISQAYIHVHACSNHLGVFLFITRDLSFHFICKKKTNRKRQATLLISKLWFSGYCFVVINFVIYTILNGWLLMVRLVYTSVLLKALEWNCEHKVHWHKLNAAGANVCRINVIIHILWHKFAINVSHAPNHHFMSILQPRRC